MMAHCGDLRADGCDDAEFLPQLAHECSGMLLARFDLAARKLPLEREALILPALTDQHTIILQEDAGDNLLWFTVHIQIMAAGVFATRK